MSTTISNEHLRINCLPLSPIVTQLHNNIMCFYRQLLPNVNLLGDLIIDAYQLYVLTKILFYIEI